MGDQWYYNNIHYPSSSLPNYNSQVPSENNSEHRGLSGNNYQNVAPCIYHQSSDQYIYQTIASYPPPAGPYSIPPPSTTGTNFGPSFSYQVQQNHYQNQEFSQPHDYTKELEHYKIIQSRIKEPKSEFEKSSKSKDRELRTPSPTSCRLRRGSSGDDHVQSININDKLLDQTHSDRSGSRETLNVKETRSQSSHRSRKRTSSRNRNCNDKGMRDISNERKHLRSFRSRSISRSRRNEAVSAKIIIPEKKIDPGTERDQILSKWRKNYCRTEKQLSDKLEELASLSIEDILERERNIWTRSTPAELFYERHENNIKSVKATSKLEALCQNFNETLVLRARRIRSLKPKYEPPPRKNRARLCKHKTEASSSSDGSDDSLTDEEDCTMEELQRKQQHPDRLHPEMWYNEPGEMNDGPLCRCSWKCKKSGIRHGIYPGEIHLERCNLLTNNADRLFHYRITISPPTNFLIKTPTIIQHDEHEFIFEGFSMFSHFPLEKLPSCKVIRFNIEYTILYIEEKIPENFTVWELNLFKAKHDGTSEERIQPNTILKPSYSVVQKLHKKEGCQLPIISVAWIYKRRRSVNFREDPDESTIFGGIFLLRI